MKHKRLFAMVLSICLLLAASPLTALADPEDPVTVLASGNFSDFGGEYASVTWCVTSDGVLTIGGVGKMPDYSYDTYTGILYTSAPYYNYKAQITSLVIESGISQIGEYAFYEWSNLTGSLTIQNGVTKIGAYAFYQCSGFSGNLILPDSITDIGSAAFYRCSGFTGRLVLPPSLTTISSSTFNQCTGFTGNLVIPDSVTKIGSFAFNWCTGLNGTLTLGGEGSQLQTIENGAFQSCNRMTGSLAVPDTVTSIGASAFYNCSGLNGALTFGGEESRLQTIGNFAFSGCSGFTGSLVIPDTVTSIGSSAFGGCCQLNGTLKLGNSVQTIGASAFTGCWNLTGSLTIPDSVQTIGERAFVSCYNLNGTLTLGSEASQLQTIGTSAFLGCSALTGTLEIPETVTSIGECAFHGCAKNTNILTFFASYPNYIDAIEIDRIPPTVTADGKITYKVNCNDPSHTTDAQKFITNFDVPVSYIFITGLTVSPVETTLAVEHTETINVTFNTDAMDQTLVFTSGDPSVATVDENGVIRAVAPGTTTVTVTPGVVDPNAAEEVKATVTVTVYDLTVPGKIVLAMGETASAAAVVTPATAVTPAVTYASSDESVFTVDVDGNITPAAVGTATLTVTDGTITKEIPVTVVDLTATADKTTLAKDETAGITVTPLNGTLQDVAYGSSDETVLTVSAAGEVTALKTGDATVTVTASVLAADKTVTVTKDVTCTVYTPVTDITATADRYEFDMEDETLFTTITVRAFPGDADNRNVIFTSSDPDVLEVETDGTVIALHKGTATVTVTAADGFGAETTLDFTVTHDLYALRIGPTVEEEESGEATVETDTARRFTVRYTSSDPEILEVDPETGVYTAKKKGTVTVTAELTFEDDTHKTLTRDVVVRDPHEGEFRCSRCDWYDEVKDTPGIRGVVYWMIHTITHFVQMINAMT